MNVKIARRVGVIAAGLITCVLLGASDCQPTEERDLEGVHLQDPQKTEIYANVNGHPNIVVMCIHGIAFATTTRENGQNFMRVEDLDGPLCGTTKTQN